MFFYFKASFNSFSILVSLKYSIDLASDEQALKKIIRLKEAKPKVIFSFEHPYNIF